MAGLIKSMRTLQRVGQLRCMSSAAVQPSVIGTREVVGYGINGEPIYCDRIDFPMPAIRFKADTADIKVLREKEKGDWKKLSLAEKKALYRASFCQTLAEVDAPTGEWKHNVGFTLMMCCAGVWVYMALKLFVYNQELPSTFSQERQQAQLKRMIELGIGRIEGISSDWDYVKDERKK